MTSSSAAAFFFAIFCRFSKINIPITNIITVQTIPRNGHRAAKRSKKNGQFVRHEYQSIESNKPLTRNIAVNVT